MRMSLGLRVGVRCFESKVSISHSGKRGFTVDLRLTEGLRFTSLGLGGGLMWVRRFWWDGKERIYQEVERS